MASNLKGCGVGMAMAAATLAPMVVPMVMKMMGGRRRKIRGRGLLPKGWWQRVKAARKKVLHKGVKLSDVFLPHRKMLKQIRGGRRKTPKRHGVKQVGSDLIRDIAVILGCNFYHISAFVFYFYM